MTTATIKLLTREEVEELTGLKRATIYYLMKKGTFPRPRKLGERAVRWPLADIAEWIESCPRTGEAA